MGHRDRRDMKPIAHLHQVSKVREKKVKILSEFKVCWLSLIKKRDMKDYESVV